MGSRVTDAVKSQKPVNLIGSADVLHSWTAIDDVAITLQVLGQNPRAWGEAWHVPTAPPLTQREVVQHMADAVGVGSVKLRVAPRSLMRVMGWFNPAVRELVEIFYQFEQPFVMESTTAQQTFGLTPTPIEESIYRSMRDRE